MRGGERGGRVERVGEGEVEGRREGERKMRERERERGGGMKRGRETSESERGGGEKRGRARERREGVGGDEERWDDMMGRDTHLIKVTPTPDNLYSFYDIILLFGCTVAVSA